MNRPPPPVRFPSFSKRHASFDSPREIPLPSPSSPRDTRDQGAKLGYFDVQKEKMERDVREELRREQRERHNDEKLSSLHSPHPSRETNHSRHSSVDNSRLSSHSIQSSPQIPHSEPEIKSSPTQPEPAKFLGEPSKQQIFPHPRPYSLPHSSSSSNSGSGCSGNISPVVAGGSGPQPVGSGANGYGQREPEQSSLSQIEGPSEIYLGTTLNFGKSDRSSSASLPLPAQIPYHTLPRTSVNDRDQSSPGNGSEQSSSSGNSSHSSSSLPFAPPLSPLSSTQFPHFRDPPPPRSPIRSPTREPPQPDSATAITFPSVSSNYSLPTPFLRSSGLSHGDDDSGSSYITAMRQPSKPLTNHPPVILEEGSSGLTRSASTGTSSAQAHTIQHTPGQSNVEDSRAEVWRNPPPVQPPRSSASPRPIGGIVNPSDLPPVLPPQRMMSRVGHGSGSGGGGSGPPIANSFSAPVSSNTSEISVPLPLPHTPPNPNSTTHALRPTMNNPPAYAPFLSPVQPPPERCWIEVETTPSEYNLNIRLEGFKRDGITLATRRRRVLHIVADSWDTVGGGHFERRISFGYDADLVGVRAEFDGEWLKVCVPRRRT